MSELIVPDKSHCSRRGRRGEAKRLLWLKKSKEVKRWHLRNPWNKPMIVFNYAAMIIQKNYRGFRVRRKRNYSANVRMKVFKRKNIGSRQLDKYLSRLDYYKKMLLPRPSWIEGGFSSWCAVRIQALWRGAFYRWRSRRKKFIVCQIGALVIQTLWRLVLYRKRIHDVVDETKDVVWEDNAVQPERPRKKIFIDEMSAVVRIQFAWRSFCNKRIYKYFRDLIRFKLKGAPSDLLRTIIPNESDLLDRAAGVHVRFRLGGSIFPPKVYFKIFTHRPLCDVGAFAPRDYSVEHAQPDPFDRFSKPDQSHNKTGRIKVGTKYFDTIVTTTADIEKWYKRDENNPWRPISSQIMDDKFAPPWMKDEIMAARKRTPFHYSRLRRQTDIDKMRRERKKLWMLKAYRAAIEAAHTEKGDGTYQHKDDDSGVDETIDNRFRLEATRGKPQHPDFTSIDDSLEDSTRRFDASKSAQLYPSKVHENRPSHNSYRADQIVGFGSKGMINSQMSTFTPSVDVASSFGKADYHGNSRVASHHHVDDGELLKWSMALDFDEYTKEWQALATSMPSNMEASKTYTLAAGIGIGN